jgi:hypothetical protein
MAEWCDCMKDCGIEEEEVEDPDPDSCDLNKPDKDKDKCEKEPGVEEGGDGPVQPPPDGDGGAFPVDDCVECDDDEDEDPNDDDNDDVLPVVIGPDDCEGGNCGNDDDNGDDDLEYEPDEDDDFDPIFPDVVVPPLPSGKCDPESVEYDETYLWDPEDEECGKPPEEVDDDGELDPVLPLEYVGSKCDKESVEYDDAYVWDPVEEKCVKRLDELDDGNDDDDVDPDTPIEDPDYNFEPPIEEPLTPPWKPDPQPTWKPDPWDDGHDNPFLPPVTDPGPVLPGSIPTGKCDPNDPSYDPSTTFWDPVSLECKKRKDIEKCDPDDPGYDPDEWRMVGMTCIKKNKCDPDDPDYDAGYEYDAGGKGCVKKPEPEVSEPDPPSTEPTGPPPVDVPKPDPPSTEPTGPPLIRDPEPPRIPYSDIPCYDDEGKVVPCPSGDPDPLDDPDGDLDDDGIKDDVDPDRDGDGIPNDVDPIPDLPEPPAVTPVDPDPPLTDPDKVVDFLGAKSVAKRVAFILDTSESMKWAEVDHSDTEPRPPTPPRESQRWTVLKNQVIRCLNSMSGDTWVWMGFFSGLGDPNKPGYDPNYTAHEVYDWARIDDSSRGRDTMLDYLHRDVSIGGSTEPNFIISQCFREKRPVTGEVIEPPEVVYFLSDGRFTEDGVMKHYIKRNVRQRVGKLPILTHTFSIVDRGGSSELQQIVGAMNIAMGFSRWKGPNTYRHISYGTLLDMDTLVS